MKLAVTGTTLLLAVVWLLGTTTGRQLDLEIVRRAAELDRASPALHASMRFATTVGEPKVVLFALLVPAAFGPEAAQATVRVAFATSAANQIVTSLLKWVTNRPRPSGHDPRSNSSFPSGHAAGAVGLAWVLSDRHRRATLWVWLAAVWISASRIFLSRHYLSDVLVGALIGILCAALARRFEKQLRATRLPATPRTGKVEGDPGMR